MNRIVIISIIGFVVSISAIVVLLRTNPIAYTSETVEIYLSGDKETMTVEIYGNGEYWECIVESDKEDSDYAKCVSDSGKEAYMGELI